jgi:signal transduction histidine kinase/CheY-like chemotaxis protein
MPSEKRPRPPALAAAQPPPDAYEPQDQRILIVPPTRRDGVVTVALLRQVDVACVVCADLADLAVELRAGVGVVMLTEAALVHPRMRGVLAALEEQPAWSDVPVLVLARERDQSTSALRVLALMRNVTILDRPASTRSLVSAVLAALNGRRRQYQIRDHLVERRRAELALLEADQRKDQFLATLAHELRNPLAPIRTGLQVLQRIPGDGDRATQVRAMMERQLGQIVKLIDDLLDVSRISTGKIVLRRERVDMRQVVGAALEVSQPMVDAAQHRVALTLPPEPVWVVGDASRLAQVVGNLLNNAAKYTPSGGVITLTLSLAPARTQTPDGPPDSTPDDTGAQSFTDRATGQAVLSVADNGVGIPPHMLASIFDMFTQVNRTLDRAQGGLGIGLSLVRRLMALHGGSAVAESAGIGQGCTVTVRLPALHTLPPTRPTLPPGPADNADTPPQRQARVLVVDDNADAAETLALLLQAHGHQTRTEYSAAAALLTAADFAPQAIFCDVGMPGMSGHELASRLRADARFATTLLVAVTGWGSADDRRRTEGAGFDYHLTKPVSLAAVATILAKL